MRISRLSIALAVAAIASTAQADQYVSPHVRSDGTFVQGYTRSSPNSTTLDNYSHQGNSNPYTGEKGYRTDSYPQQPSFSTSPGQYGSGQYGGGYRQR